MVKLIDLTQEILKKHTDPKTGISESILLGYCSNETASEHISRYVFASKFAHGIVLDVASGSCYGSSILRRNNATNHVIGVDMDKNLLLFGKYVYSIDCIRADAQHLPFREKIFDTIVSIETIEHVNDQDKFVYNLKSCLKKGGHVILSTPNKLYFSPLLPTPLNPYHAREYYLEHLFTFLKSHGFEVLSVYGEWEVARLELIRRILGSLLKFILNKLSLKASYIDKLYSILMPKSKERTDDELVDPDPNSVPYITIISNSNVAVCQYVIFYAVNPS